MLDEFAEFICWTPHRYALSIEQNIVPQDLASQIRGEMVNTKRGSVAHRLVEQIFDVDYLQVVRGPREGHLVRLSQNPEVSADAGKDSEAITLVARTPLVRAMADSTLIGDDLLDHMRKVAQDKSDDRWVRRVLRHCPQTADRATDIPSPDQAMRMWFATVDQDRLASARDLRSSRLSDARRMSHDVLDQKLCWVSGDWGPGLSRLVGESVSHLRRGGTS